MSAERDDGGPAFPVVVNEDWKEVNGGMTLRDWFAGMAITGIMQWDAIVNVKKPLYSAPGSIAEMAALTYKVADAMLAERTKRSEGTK